MSGLIGDAPLGEFLLGDGPDLADVPFTHVHGSRPPAWPSRALARPWTSPPLNLLLSTFGTSLPFAAPAMPRPVPNHHSWDDRGGLWRGPMGSGGSPPVYPPVTPDIYRIPVEEYFGWQRPVIEFTTTPPASPAKGDRYIVDAVATGAWIGREDAVVWHNGTEWKFDVPSAGWGVFNIDDSTIYFFKGGTWVAALVVP